VVEQIPGCPECDDNCYIRCNQCFAGGPNYEDEQRAETSWNERRWTEDQDIAWQWQSIKQLAKANDRLGAENAFLRLRLTPHPADAACAQADEVDGDTRGAADV
jgi:hypothetical protein